MLVKITEARAGARESYAPGDHVDLPESAAKALIKAGHATEPDKNAVAGDNINRLKKSLAEASSEIERHKKTIAEHESAASAGTARIAALESELATAKQAALPPDERVKSLQARAAELESINAEQAKKLEDAAKDADLLQEAQKELARLNGEIEGLTAPKRK